jgi:UDP-glucose 4-epimerase
MHHVFGVFFPTLAFFPLPSACFPTAQSKNLDHDEHVVQVKSELAAGHHENLARELSHQREQLRKAADAEKHALAERLNARRAGDLAHQAAQHDAATATLTEALTAAHAARVGSLEAEWHERREEAVKVRVQFKKKN